MLRLPLWSLQAIGALLILTPPVTALIGLEKYDDLGLALVAILIYTTAGLASVVNYRDRIMPAWLAWVNLSVVVVVPLLVRASIDTPMISSHDSWYVSGIGALLAVTAIRGRPAVSWIGGSIRSLSVLVWGGLGAMFNSGLGGAIALVVAANALAYALARVEYETNTYLDRSIEIEAASAIESATRRERSRRLSETLQITYPILRKISAGQIDDDLRQEARLLEAELRDGIRGKDLISPDLKASIRAARLRNIDVTVLDEGGLESLDEQSRIEIRNRFAQELDQISTGRVIIRSPKGGSTRATFVASRPGTAKPDVFLKL